MYLFILGVRATNLLQYFVLITQPVYSATKTTLLHELVCIIKESMIISSINSAPKCFFKSNVPKKSKKAFLCCPTLQPIAEIKKIVRKLI